MALAERASDWNISAPDWYGKLLVTETGSDSCQVQFKNANGIFGVAAITKDEFSSSQVLQKVKDSSRYYTVQIQDIVSGDRKVHGIGFMNRKDISQLFHCLQDYFGSQNESLVADDKSFKYTDHTQVKPDVADGFTKEMKYNDHKKVKVDVQNEETKNVKYTEQAVVKVDVKDVKYTGHEPVKVDVKDEITKDLKYAGHAPVKCDVKGEITKGVKYSGHAPIKLDVKEVKYAGNAPIKVDVKGESTKDVKFAEHQEKEVKVNIKNGISKDSKCTAGTSVTVNVSDKLNEPTKVEMDVKIGQSNEIKYSEHKKIKLDTKMVDTKKNVTHQGTLSLNVDIQDAEICYTPNSREPASEISKKRKLKSDDSQSDEDEGQIELSKSPLNIVTEKQDVDVDEEETEQGRTGLKEFAEIPHGPPVSYTLRIPELGARRRSVGPLITKPGKFDFRGPNRSLSASETETGMPYQCHRTQQFICTFCPSLKFPLKKKLAFLFQHWKEVHNIIEPHTCRFCYLSFPMAAHRLNHMKALHEVCPICPREFEKSEQLDYHIIRHYTSARLLNLDIGIEPKKATLSYKCSICSLEFETERYLRFHSQAHVQHTSRKLPIEKGNSTYLCNVCGRNFDSEGILEMHLSIAHDERTGSNNKYACPVPVCSLTFYKQNNLTHHLNIIHENSLEFV